MEILIVLVLIFVNGFLSMSEMAVVSAYYVPESMNVNKTLDFFKNHRIKSALITDEFGSVLGIVSFKDIMETIVEHSKVMSANKQGGGTYGTDRTKKEGPAQRG